MSYDEAHSAWDTFVGEGRVPNGCPYPDPLDNISAVFNFPRPNYIPALPVRNTPSMPSRQRSQPPLGLPLFNASRGWPSPSTPAKPIRERSAVPPLSTRQIFAGPSTATASPACDGSNGEGNWWVVITGTDPGVHYGRWVVSCSQFQSLISIFLELQESGQWGTLQTPPLCAPTASPMQTDFLLLPIVIAKLPAWSRYSLPHSCAYFSLSH